MDAFGARSMKALGSAITHAARADPTQLQRFGATPALLVALALLGTSVLVGARFDRLVARGECVGAGLVPGEAGDGENPGRSDGGVGRVKSDGGGGAEDIGGGGGDRHGRAGDGGDAGRGGGNGALGDDYSTLPQPPPLPLLGPAHGTPPHQWSRRDSGAAPAGAPHQWFTRGVPVSPPNDSGASPRLGPSTGPLIELT